MKEGWGVGSAEVDNTLCIYDYLGIALIIDKTWPKSWTNAGRNGDCVVV
jgi:hypothetical protein